MGNVITMNLGEQTARYIRVIAENAGKIPEGKPGAGIDAWLFVDEIIVE
jgi:hexosaminidase